MYDTSPKWELPIESTLEVLSKEIIIEMKTNRIQINLINRKKERISQSINDRKQSHFKKSSEFRGFNSHENWIIYEIKYQFVVQNNNI